MVECSVCGDPIKGWYKILKLSYIFKEALPKTRPFRETKRTQGWKITSGDSWLGGGECLEIGVETFVDDAKICGKCQEKIKPVIEQLESIFQLEVKTDEGVQEEAAPAG